MFQPEHPIGVKRRRNNVPAGTSAVNHGKGEALRARRSATGRAWTYPRATGRFSKPPCWLYRGPYASKLELSYIHPSMENNGEHRGGTASGTLFRLEH